MVYTYFNGEQWAGGIQTVNFRINNVIEQYPILFTILAIVVSCLGAPEFFLAFFSSLVQVFKFIGSAIKIKASTKPNLSAKLPEETKKPKINQENKVVAKADTSSQQIKNVITRIKNKRKGNKPKKK